MKEVALIGLVQSLFFIVILFLKKEKQLKDYFLMSIFLGIGAELLYRFLLFSNSYFLNSKVVLFEIIYWALFGPILLFYIKSVIEKNLKFKLIYLLHLVPLLISILAISVYLRNIKSYNSFVEFFNISAGITKFGLLVWDYSSPIYLLFILYILLKHKNDIKNYFSNIEKKELNWLLFLTLGFTTFCYTSIIYSILKELFLINFGISFNRMLPSILTVFVFILGLFGYKQEGIFFERGLSIVDQDATMIRKNKYQKTGLTNNERDNLDLRLVDIMQSKKPYLESEITISDLALHVGTSVHKLSQVINEKHKRNFYDFINTYRINEAKQFLSSSQIGDLKIESIAYDCGFNSKSSFYAIFKKQTHLTPTEFRQKQTISA